MPAPGQGEWEGGWTSEKLEATLEQGKALFSVCVRSCEPISEWKSVLVKALVGLMLGCKMASQTCEPALFGGGEITGRSRCVVIFLYEVMSLKIIWSLRFKTSLGRGGNLRRVIEGKACVMTRTISHWEREGTALRGLLALAGAMEPAAALC